MSLSHTTFLSVSLSLPLALARGVHRDSGHLSLRAESCTTLSRYPQQRLGPRCFRIETAHPGGLASAAVVRVIRPLVRPSAQTAAGKVLLTTGPCDWLRPSSVPGQVNGEPFMGLRPLSVWIGVAPLVPR